MKTQHHVYERRGRYPPPPRVRLRVARFAGGGWSDPVAGDTVSVCFRFKDALDIEGVLVGADATVPEPEPEVCTDVNAGPAGCGTVLCCFRGELLADEGAF